MATFFVVLLVSVYRMVGLNVTTVTVKTILPCLFKAQSESRPSVQTWDIGDSLKVRSQNSTTPVTTSKAGRLLTAAMALSWHICVSVLSYIYRMLGNRALSLIPVHSSDKVQAPANQRTQSEKISFLGLVCLGSNQDSLLNTCRVDITNINLSHCRVQKDSASAQSKRSKYSKAM